MSWTIRTDGPVTIIGEGALPTLVGPAPVPPTPVVVPPVVVPPPPPLPPEDTSPFVWPPEPSWSGYAAQRYYGLSPSGDGTSSAPPTWYCSLPDVSNPLAISHRFAGYIHDPAYLRSRAIPPDAVALWAPRNAPAARIRRVLAGGAP